VNVSQTKAASWAVLWGEPWYVEMGLVGVPHACSQQRKGIRTACLRTVPLVGKSLNRRAFGTGRERQGCGVAKRAGRSGR